jgi:hypothetical protein
VAFLVLSIRAMANELQRPPEFKLWRSLTDFPTACVVPFQLSCFIGNRRQHAVVCAPSCQVAKHPDASFA